ncbi:Planctomycete cytochrome C [Roseimaritima multifibrata]|uniref:Planctomycete cytochrome C n=1 Tax=Roseimaritima multifibrata TaxID=1930274 RepID=A0A517MEH1_9BACT|nr:Planctomycete cytochrome C [Roseimaritima multifibrata]
MKVSQSISRQISAWFLVPLGFPTLFKLPFPSHRSLHFGTGPARWLFACLLVCSQADVQADAVDFAHDVVPILRQHCAECHTKDASLGAFSMNNREAMLRGGESGEVLIAGDAANSRLIELVRSTDEGDQMPPEGPRLTADEIAILTSWVNEGAKWEAGFSFAPAAYVVPLRPRTPELPPAKPGESPNPLDRIVNAYFKSHQTQWPAEIDDATFARRVTLDLTGLLPTAEQLQQVSDPSVPQQERRDALIDSLLNDRVAYADHWISFWNDLLRNDYSGTGFIDGGRLQITDWLYDALASNLPYDQFVRQLIAPPNPESEGFIRGIRWRGNVNASQVREIQFSQNVSQVFLGINMKCASCHDSFIDEWTLEQAYGLAAVYSERPLEIHRCDKPTGKQAAAAWIFPELGSIDPAAAQPERLKQLADLVVHPDNGRVTRTIVNRLWHRLMGRGIVHPVDAMSSPPFDADLLDYLASDLAANDYDLKQTLRQIVRSRIYQSQTLVESHEPSAAPADFVFQGPTAKRLTAEQFIDAIWQTTQTAPAAIAAGGKKAPTPNPIAQQRGTGTAARAALLNSDLLMRALGRPSREQVVTTRPADLSTLQAIDLTNGSEMSNLLKGGAQSLAKQEASAETLIDSFFLACLSRQPTAAEKKLALDLLEVAGPADVPGPTGIEDLLWAVYMHPEFQLIR